MLKNFELRKKELEKRKEVIEEFENDNKTIEAIQSALLQLPTQQNPDKKHLFSRFMGNLSALSATIPNIQDCKEAINAINKQIQSQQNSNKGFFINNTDIGRDLIIETEKELKKNDEKFSSQLQILEKARLALNNIENVKKTITQSLRDGWPQIQTHLLRILQSRDTKDTTKEQIKTVYEKTKELCKISASESETEKTLTAQLYMPIPEGSLATRNNVTPSIKQGSDYTWHMNGRNRVSSTTSSSISGKGISTSPVNLVQLHNSLPIASESNAPLSRNTKKPSQPRRNKRTAPAHRVREPLRGINNSAVSSSSTIPLVTSSRFSFSHSSVVEENSIMSIFEACTCDRKESPAPSETPQTKTSKSKHERGGCFGFF